MRVWLAIGTEDYRFGSFGAWLGTGAHLEAVSRLSRRQQQKIVEVVEALVAQHAQTREA